MKPGLTKERWKALCARYHLDPMMADGLWLELKAILEAPDTSSPGQVAVAYFCERYKEALGVKTNPQVSQGARGLKQVVDHYGLEQTKDLIDQYFRTEDQWFITNGYKLLTFCSSADRIALELQTGKGMSRTAGRSAERKGVNRDAIRSYIEDKNRDR